MSEYIGLGYAAAGHDRDTLYLILREEGKDVFLADGKLRKLGSPKRKNRKHVRFLPDSRLEAVSGKLCSPLTDAALRRVLAEVKAQQAN